MMNGWISAAVKKEARDYYPEVFTDDWKYKITYKDVFGILRHVNAYSLNVACHIAKNMNGKYLDVTLIDNLSASRFCVAGNGFKLLSETRAERENKAKEAN